ncbi:hypothetical protein LCGC14_2298180, partial [marine sediment metagenome]
WTYLALNLIAYQIEKNTDIRALAYTGWTSLKSLANLAKGDFAGLTIPGSTAQIVAGIATGDKRMLKEGIAEVMRARHDLNDLASLIMTDEDIVTLGNAERHNG